MRILVPAGRTRCKVRNRNLRRILEQIRRLRRTRDTASLRSTNAVMRGIQVVVELGASVQRAERNNGKEHFGRRLFAKELLLKKLFFRPAAGTPVWPVSAVEKWQGMHRARSRFHITVLGKTNRYHKVQVVTVQSFSSFGPQKQPVHHSSKRAGPNPPPKDGKAMSRFGTIRNRLRHRGRPELEPFEPRHSGPQIYTLCARCEAVVRSSATTQKAAEAGIGRAFYPNAR